MNEIIKAGSGLIEAGQVQAAQEAGLLVHHEVETDFDGEIIRDDWYAATHEFVANYYQNGGTWTYR